jgi:hypothetical protein
VALPIIVTSPGRLAEYLFVNARSATATGALAATPTTHAKIAVIRRALRPRVDISPAFTVVVATPLSP